MRYKLPSNKTINLLAVCNSLIHTQHFKHCKYCNEIIRTFFNIQFLIEERRANPHLHELLNDKSYSYYEKETLKLLDNNDNSNSNNSFYHLYEIVDDTCQKCFINRYMDSIDILKNIYNYHSSFNKLFNTILLGRFF